MENLERIYQELKVLIHQLRTNECMHDKRLANFSSLVKMMMDDEYRLPFYWCRFIQTIVAY